MSLAGLILRLLVTAVLTWIIHSFCFELGPALYLALLPTLFYELLRSR
jgi:hypothetical protein